MNGQLLGTLSTPLTSPAGAAIVASLVDEVVSFYDDGGSSLQRLVSRVPLSLDVDRAYIARVMADGGRLSITQASLGSGLDLLGYTQSISRLPAYVRGALKSGVQGQIEDAKTFPFTPQQRKMLIFTDLGASVLTPIRSRGAIIGVFVVDMLRRGKTWEQSTLDALLTLSDAIGARMALADLGDHLGGDKRDGEADATRLNVLANVARLLTTANDPAATGRAVADELIALPAVTAATLYDVRDATPLVRDAMASEKVTVRTTDPLSFSVALPLLYDNERFGGIELALAGERLENADEQFFRMLAVFAGSAFASARRRARPRDEALMDGLTGLMSYRAINEYLSEAVTAARMSKRTISVWLIDVDGIEETNRVHGHAAGDDLLGYIGHAIGNATTDGAAGRIAGATFVAALPNITPDEAITNAQIFVERCVRQAPAHLPPVTLTIGTSSYPDDAKSADDLIKAARLGLYTAKVLGKNRVVQARARDEAWVRVAREAFIRSTTEELLPQSGRVGTQ